MVDETRLRQRFEAVRGQLDERGLRLLAAAEARAAGYGGIAAVARATGIARSTIGRGLADLDQPALLPGQVRRAGSGRKPVQEKDPTLLADLRRLVEPATLGDPMRPLLWVSKSYPPGTPKWNKIEHCLFCYITQNWRGRPLISHAAVVDLIA